MAAEPNQEPNQFDEEFQRTIITPLVDERNKLPEEKPPVQVVMAGELGDAVRKFVYWMKIKQPPQELAPFLSRCGDRLFAMGEVESARDVFYAGAMDAAAEIDSSGVGGGDSDSGGGRRAMTKALADKQWALGQAAQVAYASAGCDITATLAADPEVKFPQSVLALRRALQRIQSAMSRLLHELPAAPCHESMAWLLLNGCVELYSVCEPLVTLGFAQQVLEFLTWSVLTMEAVVTLSATKYLTWRLRLYAAVCYAYEDLGKVRGATECLAHARNKVAELRKLEEYDPPLPARVEQALRVAEGDLAVLGFKYDVALDLEGPAASLPPPAAEDAELAKVPPVLLQIKHPAIKNDGGGVGGDGSQQQPSNPTVARSRAAGYALLKWMSSPDAPAAFLASAEAAVASDDARTAAAAAAAAAALKGLASPAARWVALCESLAMGDPLKRPVRDGTRDATRAARTGRRGDGEPLRSPPTEEGALAFSELDDGDDAATARRRKLAFAAVALLVGYAPPKDPEAAASEEGKEEANSAAFADDGWEQILVLGVGDDQKYELQVTGAQVMTLLYELLRLGEGSTLVLLLTLCRQWVAAADEAEEVAYQRRMLTVGTMVSTVATEGKEGGGLEEEEEAKEVEGEVRAAARGVVVKLVFAQSGGSQQQQTNPARDRNLFTQQSALLEGVVRLKFWRRARDVVPTALSKQVHRARRAAAAAQATYDEAKAAYKAAKADDDATYAAAKAAAGGEGEEVPLSPKPSEAYMAAAAAASDMRSAWDAAKTALEDSETAYSGEWQVFAEPPELSIVGPPGATAPVPLNYVTPLVELLDEASLLGDTGDADDPTLASHAIDALADAGLFLWDEVAVPLLAQLDSAASSAPLAPPPTPLPGRRGYREPILVAEAAANDGGDGAAGAFPGGASYDSSTMNGSLLDPDTPSDPLNVPTLVRCLLACRATLHVSKVDDPVLCAKMALRVGLVLGEPTLGDDMRRAIQVVRSTLMDVDFVRGECVLPHLHRPDHPDDMTCLHRAAVTCDVDDATAEACERRLGAGGYGGSGIYGAGSVLDPLHQALASLQVDLYALLFRLELRLANKAAKSYALKQHRAAARAARAAHAKEGKGVGSSKSRNGTTTTGTLNASTVMSAGGGTAFMLGSKEGSEHAGATGERFDPLHAEPVVPALVAACEQRLFAEVRKHPHLKALLVMEIATLRARTGTGQPYHSDGGGGGGFGGGLSAGRGAMGDHSGGGPLVEGMAGASCPSPAMAPNAFSPLGQDVAKMLKDAQKSLEDAVAREQLLLTAQQPQWEDYPKARPLYLSDEEKLAATALTPPAPAILSRTDKTVTVLPRRWFPAAPKDKKKSRVRLTKDEASGPPKPPEVVYYRVYGKAAGAGTDVTLNNTELMGTAVAVAYDGATGLAAKPCMIRDLTPNEAYVFAVAAFDKDSNVIGGRIGETTEAAAEALNPLPTVMCRGYLATTALRLGCDPVAKGAAQQVVKQLCSSQHLSWALPVDEGGVNDGVSGNVGGGTGRYAAPLNSYVMASLLLKPNDLDRAPRSALLSLAQCLLVVAETARRMEDPLIADSNADAGIVRVQETEGGGSGGGGFLGAATAAGESSQPAQQNQLQRLNELTLAAELAVYLKDVMLLQRAVHAAYDNLRPLLSLAVAGAKSSGFGGKPPPAASTDGGIHRHLFQALARLHQAAATVPPGLASKTNAKLRTLLSAALSDAGAALAEMDATKIALSQAALVPSTIGIGDGIGGAKGGVLADGRADDAETLATGADGTKAALQAKDAQDGLVAGTMAAQLALYDTWQRNTALSDTLTKDELRKIVGLSISPEAEIDADSLVAGGDGGGGDAAVAAKGAKGGKGGKGGKGAADPVSDAAIGGGRSGDTSAAPETAVMSELVTKVAVTDPDRAWRLLQHPKLKGKHRDWGKYACHVLEAGLLRGSGGAGGRVVKLWMSNSSPLISMEALKPLVVAIMEFEAKQEHRQLKAAKVTVELHGAGLLGGPYDVDWAAAATFPLYVAPSVPPIRPEPGEEGEEKDAGDEAAVVGEVDAMAATAAVAVGGRDGGGGDESKLGMANNNSHVMDDVYTENLEAQLRGRPKDPKTKREMFEEIIHPPSGGERRQLLWLGRLELLLGLGKVDVLLAHSACKTKLKKVSKLRGEANDGPLTNLSLFLGQDQGVAEDDGGLLAVSLDPAPDKTSEAQLLGQAKGLLEANRAKFSFGTNNDEAGESAATDAVEAGGSSGAAVIAAEKYDASNGDVAGPLVDLVDHFCCSLLRFRAAHAWRALLGAASELWNVVTALWLSPFAYEPDALGNLWPDEAAKISSELLNNPLKLLESRPCEPWDHIAHAVLDMLEQMAVLPEPPQRDDGDSDGDGEFDQFADDEDEKPLDQTMPMVTTAAGGGTKGIRFLGIVSPGVGVESEAEDEEDDRGDDEGADGKIKVDLEWASRFVTFAMSCLTTGREWASVVVIGRRLNDITFNLPAAAEASFPLIIHAQRAIVVAARGEAERCEGIWAWHMEKVTFLEKKLKNKKRAPSSRTDKGERQKTTEEKRLEAVGVPLDRDRSNANARLQVAEYGLRWYEMGERNYRKQKSQALDALHLCRDMLAKAVHKSPPVMYAKNNGNGEGMMTNPDGLVAKTVSFASSTNGGLVKTPRGGLVGGLTTNQLQDLRQVAGVFKRASGILRDKREQFLLQQALNELGDLLLVLPSPPLGGGGGNSGNSGGDYEKAWRDSIDALFSILDADLHWEGLYRGMLGLGATTASMNVGGIEVDGVEFRDTGLRDIAVNRDPFESPVLPAVLAAQKGLLSCIIGAATLGKLSRYASSKDRCRRLSLALMAAPLWRAPLSASIAHPQRLCDYGVYTPTPATLLAGVELFNDHARLAPRQAFDALEHAAGTLVEQGEGLLALPLLSILESLVSGLCRSPRRSLRARVLRMDALRQAGLLSQAVSVLAEILTGSALGRVKGGYGAATLVGGGNSVADRSMLAVDDSDEGSVGSTAKEQVMPSVKELFDASLPNPNYYGGGNGEGGTDNQEYTRPGLPFYGLAPFWQHLPPDAVENAAALDWVATVKAGDGSGGGDGATAAATTLPSPSKGKKGASAAAASPPADEGLKGASHLEAAVAGSGDVVAWLGKELGGAGRRALALARGRLLLALTDGMGIGGGGVESYAHVTARLRGAADSIATAVVEQAVYSVFLGDETAQAATTAAVQAAAVALADGGSGEGSGKEAEAVKRATALAKWDALGNVKAARPGLCRNIVDALQLRADIAVADARFVTARLHASTATAFARQQARAAETVVAKDKNEGTNIVPFERGVGSEESEITAGEGAAVGGRLEEKANEAEEDADSAWDEFEDKGEAGAPISSERWLRLRLVLATVALQQGRNSDVLFLVTAGTQEAAAVNEVRLSRRLNGLGAAALARLGRFDEAETKAASIVAAMATDQLRGGATDFALAVSIASVLRRERALVASSAGAAQALLIESSDLLGRALTFLAKRSRASGHIGIGTLTFMGSSSMDDFNGIIAAEAAAKAAAVEAAAKTEGGDPMAITLATLKMELRPSEVIVTDNTMKGAALQPPLLMSLLEGDRTAESAAAVTNNWASTESSSVVVGGGGETILGQNASSVIVPLHSAASRCVDGWDVTAPTPLANLYLPTVRLSSGLVQMRALLALDLPASAAYGNSRSDGEGQPFGASAYSSSSSFSSSIDASSSLLASLREAEEALASLRHVAHPPAHLRARLLLSVGKLRRRTLRPSVEEAAWEPPTPSAKTPEELEAEVAAATKGGKGGKGKGGKSAGKGAAADSPPDDTANDGEWSPPMVLGIPAAHCVGACAGALLSAIAVSEAAGGHEHRLMREACLELVLLLGSVPVKALQVAHLHMAMRFLVLAADIATRERYLLEELPTVVDDSPLPLPVDNVTACLAPAPVAKEDVPPLPPAVVDELTTRPAPKLDDSVVPKDPISIIPVPMEPSTPPTIRGAVALLLSLLREEAPDPLGNLSPSQRPLIAALHRCLRNCCPAYSERCVVAPIPVVVGNGTANGPPSGNHDATVANVAAAAFKADGTPPEDLQDEFVCVQWRACEPEKPTAGNKDKDQGGGYLRSKVEAYLLLNKSVHFGKFSANREINNVLPVSIGEVRALQDLAAAFRMGLARLAADGYGANKVPAVITTGWERLLCRVHLLIRPSTTNAWVREGVLKFSDGSDASKLIDPLNPENHVFLEDLLDCDGPGVCRASYAFCAWLRDIVDPVGPPPAEAGGDEA